jgi:hypothetical protein
MERLKDRAMHALIRVLLLKRRKFFLRGRGDLWQSLLINLSSKPALK